MKRQQQNSYKITLQNNNYKLKTQFITKQQTILFQLWILQPFIRLFVKRTYVKQLYKKLTSKYQDFQCIQQFFKKFEDIVQVDEEEIGVIVIKQEKQCIIINIRINLDQIQLDRKFLLTQLLTQYNQNIKTSQKINYNQKVQNITNFQQTQQQNKMLEQLKKQQDFFLTYKQNMLNLQEINTEINKFQIAFKDNVNFINQIFNKNMKCIGQLMKNFQKVKDLQVNVQNKQDNQNIRNQHDMQLQNYSQIQQKSQSSQSCIIIDSFSYQKGSKFPNNNNSQQKTKKTLSQSQQIKPQKRLRGVPQKFSIIEKKDSQCFKIDQHLITLIDKNGLQVNQLTINYPIRFNIKLNGFKIKIIRSLKDNIFVGVLDRNCKSSVHTKVAILYHGQGYVIDNDYNVRKGQGFHEGDIVEVRLYRSQIRWTVNKQMRAIYTDEKLQSQYRYYMPFVQMYQLGDAVQWIPL